MKDYRFILEKKGSRHACPECKQRREFTRYIDKYTGELLPEQYGICNRLNRCGYSLNPYKDGYSQRVQEHERGVQSDSWKFGLPSAKVKPKPQPPASFVSNEVLKSSLTDFEVNSFALYLISLFGEDIAGELIVRYFIGSSKHLFKNKDFPDYLSEAGANVFWQIDVSGKARTGKIMLYDKLKGKRIKKPFNHVTWVHKVTGSPDFELKQCLYGEHLLRGDELSPVVIVESEKTAIIASVYFPRFLWLACGALNHLNAEKCQVLKGRHVILFPDLNAFDKWNAKAKDLTHSIPGTLFTVSDLLEKQASETDKGQGLDIADYLTRFDWRAFRGSEKGENNEAPNKTFIKADANTESEKGERSEVLNKPFISPLNLDNTKPEPIPTEQPPAVEPLVEMKHFEPIEPTCYFSKPELTKPESWEQEITELEHYFQIDTIPTRPVKLNPYCTITNVYIFIESHFATVKANNGKRTFLPYLNRLQALKQYLTPNLN